MNPMFIKYYNYVYDIEFSFWSFIEIEFESREKIFEKYFINTEWRPDPKSLTSSSSHPIHFSPLTDREFSSQTISSFPVYIKIKKNVLRNEILL